MNDGLDHWCLFPHGDGGVDGAGAQHDCATAAVLKFGLEFGRQSLSMDRNGSHSADQTREVSDESGDRVLARDTQLGRLGEREQACRRPTHR